MNRRKGNSALCHHPRRNGAVYAAGNKYSRPAGRSCGHTARALYLAASDESVLVADLDGYRNLGIVNVDLYSGVIFENNAADLVADLRRIEREFLIRTLRRDLERLSKRQLIP